MAALGADFSGITADPTTPPQDFCTRGATLKDYSEARPSVAHYTLGIAYLFPAEKVIQCINEQTEAVYDQNLN
jgi:hypothetical protein